MMKSVMFGGAVAALMSFAFAANAAYTPVEWVKASGTQWINTKYTPKCTDKIEMLVNFATKSGTQCLYCSRGTTTTTATFTSFLLNGKIRVDRNNAAGGSIDLAVAANTDYVLTVDYNARKATLTDGTTTKELTNLTDGTFAPGSPLALFASHQAGSGITDENGMDNWGSYRICYVKIFDKDGNLVREYVPVKDAASSEPRCTAGLYETLTRRFCPSNGTGALTCGDATGAPDFEGVGGDDEYVLTVEKGGNLELTAEHVAAASGKTFVKAGGGTLYVTGDTMKNFPGDIRVRDGYYVLQSTNALGTAVGRTYVEDGGTLVNEVANDKSNGSAPCFGAEVIHLKGNGCDGWGAVQNKKTCVDFCRNLVLDGPARVRADMRFDWRSAATEMNWYPLEVVAKDGGFFFVNEVFSHMGDITCTSGKLEFQAGISGCLKASTVTMKTGSQLSLWGLSAWLNCKFVLEPNVTLLSSNGTFNYAGTDNRNIVYDNDFVLQGATKNGLDKNVQYQFRSKLTGDGGIQGGKGGYLQLINDNKKGSNDFKGGLDISGVIENGNPVGGIVAYYDYNIPSGEDAAPLKLSNASLQLRNQETFHLPDLVASNRVVVSNMATVTACSAKSLKKTGADELTVFGPLSVAGKAEVDAGTLRLASRVPDVVPGLKWSYRNNEAGITSEKDQGVDLTGVGYAYKAWPTGTNISFTYKGYIRVPGEEGADVTCNWISSIARGCKVTIGGVVCCQFNDNKNVKDNETVGYARLAMYKPVTLKAGWQTITVTMNNWYDTTRGPLENKSLGWVANFGIGVDWQNRSVTNSAYYAKLQDPGDGSFLKATLDASERQTYLTESKYRATFADDVAFGPGAVFDIGDVAPYWPVTVPSLTGLPTVRNGELKVTSSTWTLRASDLAGATPLTVGANAKVTFPANVTITGDASALAYKKSVKAKDLIAVEEGGTLGATTFTLADNLKEAGYFLSIKDGVPVLDRSVGFYLIVK